MLRDPGQWFGEMTYALSAIAFRDTNLCLTDPDLEDSGSPLDTVQTPTAKYAMVGKPGKVHENVAPGR